MKTALWGILMCAPLSGLVFTSACSGSGSSARPTSVEAGVSQEIGRDDSAEIPCEPRAVLENVCQRCHVRPMRNGAPFPLERRSDVFRTYGGVEIRELMIEEVTARRMPLAPVTIDDAQRDTLLAWVKAGAPPIAPSTCADQGADVADASDDAGGGEDAGAEARAGDQDANDDDSSTDEGALLFDGGDDQ